MHSTTETPIVVILIRAESGELFVHQRRADKRLYPRLFGLGAGGRIEPGESPSAAASRELWEETGLQAEPRALFQLSFASGPVRHRLFVFEHITSEEPQRNSMEWQWAGWLTAGQVERLGFLGKLCPDTARIFARYTEPATSPVASDASSVA